MSNGQRCSKCNSANLRWLTMRNGVPVDVLQCKDCGTQAAVEDWQIPSLPMKAGRCMNCGDLRKRNVCQSCGLSAEDDVQVHDELRQLVNPRAGFLQASHEASRQGRRLLALKMATAAAHFNDEGQGEAARALRVWLLAAIGEAQSAMEDAKAWVEESPDPTPAAWASLGQQYLAGGFPGSAADAFGKALAKEPGLAEIRAKRAQIMLGMRREGQAAEEVFTVLAPKDVPAAAVDIAVEVAAKIADALATQNREDEIKHLLKKCHVHVERSAKLLAHRARMAALDGDVNAAKADLKSAKALEPELPAYEEIKKLIKPQQSSWWRW